MASVPRHSTDNKTIQKPRHRVAALAYMDMRIAGMGCNSLSHALEARCRLNETCPGCCDGLVCVSCAPYVGYVVEYTAPGWSQAPRPVWAAAAGEEGALAKP
jgi:hypothetical protein